MPELRYTGAVSTPNPPGGKPPEPPSSGVPVSETTQPLTAPITPPTTTSRTRSQTLFASDNPVWRFLKRWGFPLFRRLINRVLDIRPGIEREDEAAVWREFDFVADLLSDGRPHLCGERFGAADMTFAAMSAPVIVPPIYGVPLPQPDILPPDTAALVERGREHPAGRYALRLYADYRRMRVVDLPRLAPAPDA